MQSLAVLQSDLTPRPPPPMCGTLPPWMETAPKEGVARANKQPDGTNEPDGITA